VYQHREENPGLFATIEQEEGKIFCRSTSRKTTGKEVTCGHTVNIRDCVILCYVVHVSCPYLSPYEAGNTELDWEVGVT
jgi:hypothetical protein